MIVPGFNHRFPKEGSDDYLWSYADCQDRASPLIESCCTTLDEARAAQSRGAGRIELCVDLAGGGFTPPRDLIRDVVAALTIPVNVLIRPQAWEGSSGAGRFGDCYQSTAQAPMDFAADVFVYDEAELQQMIEDIAYCRSVGVAGIVVGALTPVGAIDQPAMRRLIAAARPLPVTFHRAFDVCAENPFLAIDELIALGCARLLTSGQASNAWEGRELIQKMVQYADGQLIILAGKGVTPDNLAALAAATGAKEFHGTRLP